MSVPLVTVISYGSQVAPDILKNAWEIIQSYILLEWGYGECIYTWGRSKVIIK